MQYRSTYREKLKYKDNKELEEFIGQEKKVIEITGRIAVGVYGERANRILLHNLTIFLLYGFL